ncbi:DUF1566 domain-containing protein [bacterium]|nr:DUF1566 domain-containing protein [bacterium]
MKKIFVCFAIFAALIFVVSCGGGSKNVNQNDEPDTGEIVTDGDTADSESSDADPSDSGHENSDTNPEQPDNGDSQPDDGDTAPDEDDAEPTEPTDQPESCELGELMLPDELPARYFAFKGIGTINNANSQDAEPASLVSVQAAGMDGANFQYANQQSFFEFGQSYVFQGTTDAVILTVYSGDDDYSVFAAVEIPVDYMELMRKNEIYELAMAPFTLINVYKWTSDRNYVQRCIFRGRTDETKQTFLGNTKVCYDKNVDFSAGETFKLNMYAEIGSDEETADLFSDIESVEELCPCFDMDYDIVDCQKIPEFANGEPVNPCESNPCGEYSDVVCSATSYTAHSCECSSGYFWHGKAEGCKTEPATLGNICTGQNKCYVSHGTMICPVEGEDFFGQDAWYASLGKCAPQSFTVQTISNQKVVLDNNTGLMWQQTIPTDPYKWDGAVSYCNSLSYAGYSDWRLPTPQELLTIVDNRRYGPAIDTTYFPDTPLSYFWSSSTVVGNTDNAWIADFYDGGVGGYNKTEYSHVRCVRGESLLSSTFEVTTVNGDVIVTDTKTGLVWQKTYETGKNWQAALDYCENLTYAGYSDWRLPNKNELASLVNYEKSYPASDFPDMPSEPSEYFWSSSTRVYSTGDAWGVSFYYGVVYGYDKPSNVGYVRCVR